MGVIIQVRRGTAAQWSSVNPILAEGELAIERDTLKLKIGDGATVWSLLPYAYSFITLGDATYAIRGIVEKATAQEVRDGTELGGTGASLFVGPDTLKTYRDLSETTASLAGSTLTCDCADKVESRFVYATLSANASIVFSNKTNSKYHSLIIAITGSSIVLTFESDVRMARYNESGTVWNPTTKALTVSSIAAGDLHEFSLLKTGSIFILRYDGPVRP
jgi:hypothetical protein